MNLKKKSLYSQNNRISFLDLVPWNSNSEIFEESNVEDKLISNECKIRNIKHSFKLIKANRLIKIIIKYKKIIIKNNNSYKKYLEFINNKKILRPIFYFLISLIMIKNIFSKNRYSYTFMVCKPNSNYYFDNFNPLKNIEKHTPKIIFMRIFLINTFKILSDSIKIDSIIEEKF